ncbi:MAG: diacylglycerol kinase family protein [Bacillus sp. (in: firmicutes)]
MNSDLKDKKRWRVLFSFKYAIAGIRHGITHERNFKIHTICALLVIIFGIIFDIDRVEWMFVLFAIGGMLSLELINTAIERTVDYISPQFHLFAKQAKDVAAGAVFIYACLSVIIGCIIFLPKIF